VLFPSSVAAMMPGPTETNFFHRSGLDDTLAGKLPKDDPVEVGRYVAESLSGKVTGLVSRVLSDAVKAPVAGSSLCRSNRFGDKYEGKQR
jgi:uncharacterized protein